MWVNSEIQKNPERHVYILCVEVSTFNGIPDWYMKLTVPDQKCVVVANEKGDFNAASEAVDEYVKANHFKVSSEGRDYLYVKDTVMTVKDLLGIRCPLFDY